MKIGCIIENMLGYLRLNRCVICINKIRVNLFSERLCLFSLNYKENFNI